MSVTAPGSAERADVSAKSSLPSAADQYNIAILPAHAEF
jgi:hypothetical protein